MAELCVARAVARRGRAPAWAGVVVGVCCVGGGPARAGEAFFGYGAAYRTVHAPPIAAGSFNVVGDALPDGRLVAATGTGVYVETAPGSGAFALGASIDPAVVGGATDPAFLRVSPDGSRVALGAGFGRPLLVFGTSLLSSAGSIDGTTALVFTIDHYSAAWQDASHLAITGGAFGSPSVVTLLDTTSSPAAPVNPVIISNIGGASAGVAFDAQGRLFTANGFDTLAGGSETGWIKAFDPASWSGGPADFETGGVFVADLLSGEGLNFDAQGNLFVGGGDFGSGDAGTLAVVRAGAIDAALAGGGAVDVNNPLSVRRLDPRGDGFGFFGSIYDGATGELYVTDGATWYATVPGPGGMALAGVSLGALARRRRRHDA